MQIDRGNHHKLYMATIPFCAYLILRRNLKTFSLDPSSPCISLSIHPLFIRVISLFTPIHFTNPTSMKTKLYCSTVHTLPIHEQLNTSQLHQHKNKMSARILFILHKSRNLLIIITTANRCGQENGQNFMHTTHNQTHCKPRQAE